MKEIISSLIILITAIISMEAGRKFIKILLKTTERISIGEKND